MMKRSSSLPSRLGRRRAVLWLVICCCWQSSVVVRRRATATAVAAAASFCHPLVHPRHQGPSWGIRGAIMTTTAATLRSAAFAPAPSCGRCHHRDSDGLLLPPIFAGCSTALWATKTSGGSNSSKKKSSSPKRGVASSSSSSLSGFGGAAVQSCSCGSNLPYNKCCGKIHRDPQLYAVATPSEVVRARYTAYAKRVVDFIVESTHPLNPSIAKGVVEHWKRTIESNCYDNFLLNSCVILEEHVHDNNDTATVKFEAKMTHRETGERTAFVETSTFLRDPTTKAWLYRDGVITSPKDEPSVVAAAADAGTS